jgi:hypothetical protein
VDELDFGWKQLVDTMAYDGMSLSAADFHDRPPARYSTADLVDHTFYQCSVTVFGDVFHGYEGNVTLSDTCTVLSTLQRGERRVSVLLKILRSLRMTN